MNRSLVAAAAVLFAAACTQDKKQPADEHRFQVRRISESAFEILPATDQLPLCLAFTTSEKGVVRQLTMTHENKSMHCEAGQPIGGLRFRAPADEGKVKVHVFFSDQKLNAASVGQQIFELVSENQDVNVMALRLPGHVVAETQEFVPEAEREVQTGAVIGAGGIEDAGSQAADGGASAADAGSSINTDGGR